MEEIYEPLRLYKEKFRDDFATIAADAFDEMEKQSGVDIEDNEETCKKIDSLAEKISIKEGIISNYKVLKMLLLFVAVVCACSPFTYNYVRDRYFYDNPDYGIYAPYVYAALVAFAVILTVLVFTLIKNKMNSLKGELVELVSTKNKNIAEANAQMEPLNSLFSWDIPVKLIEKTVPQIHFDAYFNKARLQQLYKEFDFDDSLNNHSSVLFAQSGEINGNPFIIATLRKFCMGIKVYRGYKTITWEEEVRDSDGNWKTVTRSETLVATVEKPFPTYKDQTFLLYAHDAAPNLIFSRSPEGLEEESWTTEIKRKRKLKNLQKFSQKLNDDSDYTLMSNSEFEVLFSTKDRNDEVEYRLLFTPVAQQAITALIKDNGDSFGDEFCIYKRRKLNMVTTHHLSSLDLDTNPRRFMSYRFEEIKNNFVRLNGEYFKTIYFAFAPLLSIPLYQQKHLNRNEYGKKEEYESSFWEWEAIANYNGEEKYAHQSCVTHSILKTQWLADQKDGEHIIEVTAHGFSGTDCVDSREVYGGDGHFHTVYIDWVRYDPVTKRSELKVSEKPDSDKEIKRTEDYPRWNFRRRIWFE